MEDLIHGNSSQDCIQVSNEVYSHELQIAQLAAIVAYSQDAIISNSSDGIITSWNQAAENLLGYSAQDIIGHHGSMLIPVERQVAESQILQSVHQGHTIKTYETQRQHKDGNLVEVEVTISPIGDENGRLIGTSEILRDIRDRKQVELALQKSEITNRALIQAIPDFLVRMRCDGLQMKVLNHGAIHCLYSENGIGGSYVNDIMPLEIAQERIRLAKIAIATGQIQKQEYKFIDQGKTYYEEARIVPLWNDEVLVVVGDISDRKQAELALKSAKEQLELVLQASSEGFWDLNVATGEIYFSPQWKAMLGYADHELENTLDMWVSMFLKEDQESALKLLEEEPQSGDVNRYTSTQRCRHKNGSIVYVLSRTIHLKDEYGMVTRMIGSHLDMTQLVKSQNALKTSEMQLSGILSSSLDGIMAFQSVRDQQGEIIDFEWLLINPTAYSILARQGEDLIGKRLLVEMPGNREEGLFDLYVQVVERGEPIQRQFYYKHEEVDCWFETIAVKLGDGFAVTFRNITATKQSETAIQQVNQQLEENIAKLNTRHAEMLVLGEISDFLQACFTIEEACMTLSQLVEPLFPDCAGGIFITKASRNLVELIASWGESFQSDEDFLAKDCWALRRGRIHLVDVHRVGLRCNHIHGNDAVSASLCIPMIAQGETLGLFYLNTNNPNGLPEAKQQLARTLAEQVSMAIANLRLQETLKQQSIRDPLTGLFNRRYLEEIFNQELSRAQRQQHDIGVIMIDIDHFKRFNDSYGHDGGDYVLQSVGTLLKSYVRSSDIACRYGGEEMILVLPDSTLEATSIRAEEIRVAIAQIVLNHNGQILGNLTASFGVASFPQHGSTAIAVMQAADAALYRAKAAGRNQVLSAP